MAAPRNVATFHGPWGARDDAHARSFDEMAVQYTTSPFGFVEEEEEVDQQGRKPYRKRSILCLDGGGIRGISTLSILQKLMEQIKKDSGLGKTPRPCEYFDLIGGTSTGGIIAIMLGRLRMTVMECIKAYRRMAEKAFTPVESRWPMWARLPAPPVGAFSGPTLADAVKEIVRERLEDAEAVFADKECVKTVVLAVTKANVGASTTKFKTYDIGDEFEDCRIWEIARATSAATTFFPSISCGHQRIEFIDAGFGHNNPSEVLLTEAKDSFPSEEYDCILSIGTGLGGVIPIEDSRKSILKALQKMASNCEAVHQRLDELLPDEVYFRFNVTKGLDDVTLSDCDKSSHIAAHTSNYLAEAYVDRRIRQCAKILARDTQYFSPCQDDKITDHGRERSHSQSGDPQPHKKAHQPHNAMQAAVRTFRLQQRNIPQQVTLSNPVTLFDGFNKQPIAFSLDWIDSLTNFILFIAQRAETTLEDRFRDKGSAKFRKQEFQLQDEHQRPLNLRRPWNTIMEPGDRRYLSVKFHADDMIRATTCPHCQAENEVIIGRATVCGTCQVTYQRIFALDEDTTKDSTTGIAPKHMAPKANSRLDISEDELRLCFHRIVLMLDDDVALKFMIAQTERLLISLAAEKRVSASSLKLYRDGAEDTEREYIWYQD